MLSGPSNSFSASYDSTAKIITAGVCVVLLVPVLAIRNVVVGCISALILLLCYAYSPRGYIISERSIFVRRLIGSVRISLDGIREVRAAVPDDLRRCIRLFGSGGVFVVLVTSEKTTVFSPDDVNAFLAAVRTSAPVPEGSWSEPISSLMQSNDGGGSICKLGFVVRPAHTDHDS